MKLLWLSLISIVLLVRVSSYNIAGTWISNWQNAYAVDDIPVLANITITQLNATFVNVTHSFYIISLVLNQTSNTTWSDSKGDSIVYNPTSNSLLYTMHSFNSVPLLFENSASNVTQNLALGFIGGVWNNPVPTADSSTCCPPTSLFFYHELTYFFNYIVPYSSFTYNSNCSSNNPGTLIFVPQNPVSGGTVTFGSFNGTNHTQPESYQVQITPLNSTSRLTLVLNSSCSYYYSRNNQANLFSGSWVQDWQTPQIVLDFENLTYQVAIQNNLYMTSTLNYPNENPTSGFVVQRADGSYYDSSLESNFTYSNPSNTITFTSPLDYHAFFTPNGSILSMTPFLSYWDDRQGPGGSCCNPYALHISNESSILGNLVVVSYYSNATLQGLDCFGLQLSAQNNQIETYVSIYTPSPYFLNFTDGGIAYYFANGSSALTVADLFNPACTYTMTATSALPPMPDSSKWISHQVVVFVAGIFMAIFYL